MKHPGVTVGAKDALGQQLERALWASTGSPGPMEATTLMTTGDHLRRSHHRGHRRYGYQDGQRVAGTQDGSRLEDGSVGCSRTAPPRARRVDRSAGPPVTWEVYGAELHAIYRAMLTLFQEPRGQKTIILTDAQAALQRITSDAPGPGHRYALAIAQQAHCLRGSNEESPSNSYGSPAMQAPPATRRLMSGQRWQHGTNAAQRNCLTSSAAHLWPTKARYHRAEVGRGMLMDGVALEQAPRHGSGYGQIRRRSKLAKR